jgi:hypothetical protein
VSNTAARRLARGCARRRGAADPSGIKTLDYVFNFTSGSKARTAEQFWADWDESGGIPALASFGELKTTEQCSDAAKSYGEALDRFRAEQPPRELPIRIATARLAVVVYRWGEIEMSGGQTAKAEEKARWAQSLIDESAGGNRRYEERGTPARPCKPARPAG